MNIYVMLVGAWVFALLVATWTPRPPRERRKPRRMAAAVAQAAAEQPAEPAVPVLIAH